MRFLIALAVLICGTSVYADECDMNNVPRALRFNLPAGWTIVNEPVSGEFENAVQYLNKEVGGTMSVQFVSVCEKSPEKAMHEVATILINKKMAEIVFVEKSAGPAKTRHLLVFKNRGVRGRVLVDRVMRFPGMYVVVIGYWPPSQHEKMLEEFQLFTDAVRNADTPPDTPFFD